MKGELTNHEAQKRPRKGLRGLVAFNMEWLNMLQRSESVNAQKDGRSSLPNAEPALPPAT